MAVSRRGGGIGSIFMKILFGIVIAGVLLALLRVFNWDPFGIVSWVWNIVSGAVNAIADFLTGNSFFRKAVSSPAEIFIKNEVSH